MSSNTFHAQITSAPFGEIDGRQVSLFTLTDPGGNYVQITNYGSTITSWHTKDKNRHPTNIVIGFKTLKEYLLQPGYWGATIGRFANIIDGGRCPIENEIYYLSQNFGSHHLHGGFSGFNKKIFNASITSGKLVLSYLSPDGEEGYPGNLLLTVIFSFKERNRLVIDYQAETDRPTAINVTNHSYFNLTGNPENSILHHQIAIDADYYLPVRNDKVTTGQISPVGDSPFDLRSPVILRDRILQSGGFNHNYILNPCQPLLASPQVMVSEDHTGLVLKMWTDEPGVQFYTGNSLNGSCYTSEGQQINRFAALCLEPQHFPDTPNKPQFPTALLRPGESFRSTTVYELSQV